MLYQLIIKSGTEALIRRTSCKLLEPASSRRLCVINLQIIKQTLRVFMRGMMINADPHGISVKYFRVSSQATNQKQVFTVLGETTPSRDVARTFSRRGASVSRVIYRSSRVVNKHPVNSVG